MSLTTSAIRYAIKILPAEDQVILTTKKLGYVIDSADLLKLVCRNKQVFVDELTQIRNAYITAKEIVNLAGALRKLFLVVVDLLDPVETEIRYIPGSSKIDLEPRVMFISKRRSGQQVRFGGLQIQENRGFSISDDVADSAFQILC